MHPNPFYNIASPNCFAKLNNLTSLRVPVMDSGQGRSNPTNREIASPYYTKLTQVPAYRIRQVLAKALLFLIQCHL